MVVGSSPVALLSGLGVRRGSCGDTGQRAGGLAVGRPSGLAAPLGGTWAPHQTREERRRGRAFQEATRLISDWLGAKGALVEEVRGAQRTKGRQPRRRHQSIRLRAPRPNPDLAPPLPDIRPGPAPELWRCATRWPAAALCCGLGCCSSETPSPRYRCPARPWPRSPARPSRGPSRALSRGAGLPGSACAPRLPSSRRDEPSRPPACRRRPGRAAPKAERPRGRPGRMPRYISRLTERPSRPPPGPGEAPVAGPQPRGRGGVGPAGAAPWVRAAPFSPSAVLRVR